MQIAGISPSASRVPHFPFPISPQLTANPSSPANPVGPANPARPAIPWGSSSSTSSWRGRGRAGWRGSERGGARGGVRGGWRPESGPERGGGAQLWRSESRTERGGGPQPWRPESGQAQVEGQGRWQGQEWLERYLSNPPTNPDQNSPGISTPGAPGTRVARPGSPPPVRIDLRKIADEASVLLELFSKTQPVDNGDVKDEHRQLIDSASRIISKIQQNFRVIDARKGKNIAALEPPISNTDDMKVDIGCIICYSHAADVLLLPCKHLVLCMVCVSLLTFRLI